MSSSGVTMSWNTSLVEASGEAVSSRVMLRAVPMGRPWQHYRQACSKELIVGLLHDSPEANHGLFTTSGFQSMCSSAQPETDQALHVLHNTASTPSCPTPSEESLLGSSSPHASASEASQRSHDRADPESKILELEQRLQLCEAMIAELRDQAQKQQEAGHDASSTSKKRPGVRMRRKEKARRQREMEKDDRDELLRWRVVADFDSNAFHEPLETLPRAVTLSELKVMPLE
eukprot:TRINITY_DN1779_c0_g1_i1.p1 TRINITY_DN1779_c0_g1~~TRINITY_DN1779_c0_g1_i1.p1  ORF type:complete len:231 (-),score=23.65 TRINITY_DN1779_c0_g1_i1:1076-1768(-)